MTKKKKLVSSFLIVGILVLLIIIRLGVVKPSLSSSMVTPPEVPKAAESKPTSSVASETLKKLDAPLPSSDNNGERISSAPATGKFSFTPGKKSREEIRALEHDALLKRIEQNDIQYEPLYKELSFGDEQKAKLVALKAKEYEQQRLLVQNAILKTIDNREARPQEVEAAKASAHADYLSQLRQTFGDTTASDISAFERTLPVSYITRRIADAINENSPLDPNQMRSLRDIVARSAVDGFGNVNPSSLRSDVLTFEARKILTDQQYLILDSLKNNGVLNAPLSKQDYGKK